MWPCLVTPILQAITPPLMHKSALQVEPRELVVPASGMATVSVRVLLDDAAPFKDTLHVLVAEGADISIPLEAIGVGNTVVSEVLSKPELDFGPQFVGRPWQMEVEVTNMGRKAVSLTWTNKKLTEALNTMNKAAKATGECLLAAVGCHVLANLQHTLATK